MQRILSAFKSKRVWTIVSLVLINGIPAVSSEIPANFLPLVNGVLLVLGVYFGVPAKNS